MKGLKRTTLIKTAKNLVFHLKRFQFDNTKQRHEKIHSSFLYPTSLQLNGSSSLYTLHGVVCHIGEARGGHYTSFIQVGQSEWYWFNDSRVCRSSNDEMTIHGYGTDIDVRLNEGSEI